MATPAVQAASCAGAATAVITTTVVVVPTADGRPECFAYASNTDFTSSTDKLGKDAWMLFIDAKNSKNKDWWEWSFRQLEVNKKKLTGDFANVTSGYNTITGDGTNKSTTLNQLCFYFLKNTTTAATETTADVKGIWEYCSPVKNKPKKISETDETKNYSDASESTFLGKTKQAELVALNGNDSFWEVKNYWFQSKKPGDAFFSQFLGKEKNLKAACEKAYSTSAVTNGTSGSPATKTNPVETDVINYCGLKVSLNS